MVRLNGASSFLDPPELAGPLLLPVLEICFQDETIFFLTEFRVPHLLWFYFAPTEFNLQLLF